MGFVDTLRILDRGRIGIAASSLGIAQAASRPRMRYAKGREQFGHADRRLPGRAVQDRRHGA
jgi:alkylation response protein AidB-like acyl-CoA dehydrogenase